MQANKYFGLHNTGIYFIDDEDSVYFCGRILRKRTSPVKIEPTLPPIARVLHCGRSSDPSLLDWDGAFWLNKKRVDHPGTFESGCQGYGYSVLLDTEGNVWTQGINHFGSLGTADFNQRDSLTKINISNIVSFAAANHTLFLGRCGTVWGCGANANNQLGLGHQISISVPTVITGLPPIKELSCGLDHSLFLAESGEVWLCGRLTRYSETNAVDVLEPVERPIKLQGIPPIINVCSGQHQGMLIDERQRVWAMGQNPYGQLGLGDYLYRNVPELITGLPPIHTIQGAEVFMVFMDVNSELWACGDLEAFGCNKNALLSLFSNAFRPTPVKINIRVKTIREIPKKSARFTNEPVKN